MGESYGLSALLKVNSFQGRSGMSVIIQLLGHPFLGIEPYNLCIRSSNPWLLATTNMWHCFWYRETLRWQKGLTFTSVVLNHVPGGPPTLHVFHVTLINTPDSIISSLVETPRPELLGIRQRWDEKCAVLGASRKWLGTTALHKWQTNVIFAGPLITLFFIWIFYFFDKYIFQVHLFIFVIFFVGSYVIIFTAGSWSLSGLFYDYDQPIVYYPIDMYVLLSGFIADAENRPFQWGSFCSGLSRAFTLISSSSNIVLHVI